MRIGIRKSPHLENVIAGMVAGGGIEWTSTNDTGADLYLCWGWPQAEQVARDNGGQHERIICVDAHPFALKAGDVSGRRIVQAGNWGAMARYPPMLSVPMQCYELLAQDHVPVDIDGPVLVLGQVYTAEQQRLGLVDVWHTGGYEEWFRSEMAQPNRKFRPHPRVWMRENDGESQPSLMDEMRGCSRAVTWNSTAGVHAIMAGLPCTAAEVHGWAHMDLRFLAALGITPAEMRNGGWWAHTWRPWLEETILPLPRLHDRRRAGARPREDIHVGAADTVR